MSCYQLRANFTGSPPFGKFCDVIKFQAVKENGTWEKIDGYEGSGTWNRGTVSVIFGPEGYFTGQVFDQAAKKLVLTGQDGRQLILVNDITKACGKTGGLTGPCQN